MSNSETQTGSGNLFEAMTEVEEEDEPECRISGCDRPGVASRKIRKRNTDDPAFDHYLCQFHYRVILAVKIGIVLLVVTAFLFALFNL